MGNQQFCNCNKVNSVDELTTEKGDNKRKRINLYVAQKVDEWSINLNKMEGEKCSDLPLKCNDGKLSEFKEGINITPKGGLEEKISMSKKDMNDENIKYTEEEFPINNEFIQYKNENNFRISEFNTFNDDNQNDINFEDEIPYIYSKPKLNGDMKSLIISESFNQQLQKIDEIELNKTKPEIRMEHENNIDITNQKCYSSFINNNNIANYIKENNISSKRTHFNRSGELIYYKSYDDKYVPINQNNFDTNVGERVELTEGNERVETFQDNKNVNENDIIISSPPEEEKSAPNPITKSHYNTIDQSAFANFHNNLYIKKKPKFCIKKMNTSENKPISDPIYIENESIPEQYDIPDSIENGINTTNHEIDNLKRVNFQ
jgi:hypothetical protein